VDAEARGDDAADGRPDRDAEVVAHAPESEGGVEALTRCYLCKERGVAGRQSSVA